MYYVVYGFLYLLSLLPWRVIYIISDAVYGLIYYVVGYRRKVVMANLDIAFPEKTKQEKIRIAKDFYHNFVDTMIEIIKLISISRKEFDRRVTINAEVMNDLYPSGQSIQLMTGHFFNWEFLNLALSANLKLPFLGVYIPITNKIFERIFLDFRSKFGTIMIPAPEFKNIFHQYANEAYSLGLIVDQNPGDPGAAYWYPFFGRMTPFVKGPEKGARNRNAAIVVADFYKVKRGYYKIDCTLLTTTPNEMPQGEITKALVHFIEDSVRKRPANYLWSHRRWKFEYNDEKYWHLVLK